jgi:hypothetical protein
MPQLMMDDPGPKSHFFEMGMKERFSDGIDGPFSEWDSKGLLGQKRNSPRETISGF